MTPLFTPQQQIEPIRKIADIPDKALSHVMHFSAANYQGLALPSYRKVIGFGPRI